jgi:cell division protein FtsB
MIEFKKKNAYNFWHSPLVLGILFIVLIVFIFNLIKIIDIYKETGNKKSLILYKIDELEEREASLKNNISNLETEEGVENIIREKYPLVKEGEKMVTIVSEKNENIDLSKEKKDHGFVGWFNSLFKK